MGTGLSLHVGINSIDPVHYGGWSGPLAACENDARAMYDLAQDLGYESVRLLTGQATRAAVTSSIEEAAARLQPGDTFLLTYAGHGGQIPDKSGDEDDNWDETWCLFDGQLLDDELFALWGRFSAGVRLIVVSDSCHSGSVTRAIRSASTSATGSNSIADAEDTAGPARRYMPFKEALRTYRQNQVFYQELEASLVDVGEPLAAVRLLSGCQDDQSSLDGDVNGLFTSVLLTVWDEGAFGGDYAAFHNEIAQLMPRSQSPNHSVLGGRDPDFDGQKPFTR